MKIGNLNLANRLILAPMAEVTDSSFRKIAKEHGAGLTFTQMVSALGVLKNEFEALRHLSFHRSEKPIGVQILGSDPEIMGESVKEISKFKPDLIDLNCGCPVDKVVNFNMGSALLENPKQIGKIIRRMVDSSAGIPVSVKLRLGKDKSSINILETAKIAEENGASLLFVHARTRADKYFHEPDWLWIKKAKEAVSIPVVGNGSVFNHNDALELIKNTGCDSVLVARGAIGNPFIFERFNSVADTGIDPGAPQVTRVRDVFFKHLNLLELDYGPIVSLDKAKKHSIWYFKNYPGVNDLLSKVFSVSEPQSLRNLIDWHTDKILNGAYGSHIDETINNKFKKKILFWLAEDPSNPERAAI